MITGLDKYSVFTLYPTYYIVPPPNKSKWQLQKAIPERKINSLC